MSTPLAVTGPVVRGLYLLHFDPRYQEVLMLYLGEMMVYASVEVHDPEPIERVTGPYGDEWRSQFYDFHTAEEVIEHFIFNAVTIGVRDITRLDGWADCDPAAVTISIEDTDINVRSHP